MLREQYYLFTQREQKGLTGLNIFCFYIFMYNNEIMYYIHCKLFPLDNCNITYYFINMWYLEEK